MKTPPRQVDTMPADQYFAYAAELLKVIPPHITDQPIIARMRRIGIVPGKAWSSRARSHGAEGTRRSTGAATAHAMEIAHARRVATAGR
jgi:hypothetical protein